MVTARKVFLKHSGCIVSLLGRFRGTNTHVNGLWKHISSRIRSHRLWIMMKISILVQKALVFIILGFVGLLWVYFFNALTFLFLTVVGSDFQDLFIRFQFLHFWGFCLQVEHESWPKNMFVAFPPKTENYHFYYRLDIFFTIKYLFNLQAKAPEMKELESNK